MSRSTDDAAWESAAAGFKHALERYYAERGRDPSTPASQSTVRTNTELVPKRAQTLLRLLREFAGRDRLAGVRLVEAGCGFGALAGYLAWSCDQVDVTAFDMRDDFIEAAREGSKDLGVSDRLRYVHADMRDFEACPDGSADVVLLNNAFIYLPTRAGMERALKSVRRVLAPGGHVVLYHANRWRTRDPFSHDPLVHLLPAALADVVSNATGWRHNHGRVRLVSPPTMARMLRDAGFRNVQIGALRGSLLLKGSRAYLAPFYGTVAEVPLPASPR